MNAAWVLGRAGRLGRIAPGYDGDVVILEADDWRHVAYHLGGRVIGGRVQARRVGVIERARQLCFADALSLAAASLCAAGVVVTGDGLVSAAQRSSAASAMSWHDRLLLGLWTFRLEHALWFTLGLMVLWVGLGLGGQLGRHTETVARIAGGVAIGFVLLAAAVVLGSTVVALTGSVGGGSDQISFSGRERLATWLLQSSTAVAMAAAWGLAGVRIGERFAIAGDRGDAGDEHEQADDFERLVPIGGRPRKSRSRSIHRRRRRSRAPSQERSRSPFHRPRSWSNRPPHRCARGGSTTSGSASRPGAPTHARCSTRSSARSGPDGSTRRRRWPTDWRRCSR